MTLEIKSCKSCGRHFQTEADYLNGTSRWRLCSLGHLWFNCSCQSTLLIKKGKFPWYSPDKTMSSEASGVFNKLGGLPELPYVPSSVFQLQQMISDPEIEPEELARAAKEEPFIAANVLQMAETLRRIRNPDTTQIESMVHAIMYIGRAQFGEIVITAALKAFKIREGVLNETAFWQEAHLTGAISESISQKFSTGHIRDQVYVAGTLANIGKLVTAICFPDLSAKITKDVVDVKKLPSWRQAEKIYKFPNHSVLGEIAATLWGLPEYVMNAARKHHSAPAKSETRKKSPCDLSFVVGFANQLAHWLLLQPNRMEAELMEEYMRYFGVSENEVESMVNGLMPLRDQIIS